MRTTMNETDYIATLSEAERKALAICGISKDSQLAACSLPRLLADLQKAREFFAEEVEAMPDTRLTEIYHTVCRDARQDSEAPTGENITTPDSNARQCPTLVVSRRHKRGSAHKHGAGEPDIESMHDKKHCIHCIRPGKIYLAAWSVILLYLDLAAWFILPALMLLGIIPLYNPIIIIPALILPVLIFVVCSGGANCTVCNVKVFSLRKFGYNRYAHNWPLVGQLLPTALHVIFCLWYRCPACGTPQSLLRRSPRR